MRRSIPKPIPQRLRYAVDQLQEDGGEFIEDVGGKVMGELLGR